MDNLEQIMKEMEKEEIKRERYLRTTKTIRFFKKLNKKILSFKLVFLVTLFQKLTDFIELQYSKAYEAYYKVRYKRTISRFQLLAGITPQEKKETYYGEDEPVNFYTDTESLPAQFMTDQELMEAYNSSKEEWRYDRND